MNNKDWNVFQLGEDRDELREKQDDLNAISEDEKLAQDEKKPHIR